MKVWMIIEIERENKYVSTMERIDYARKTEGNYEPIVTDIYDDHINIIMTVMIIQYHDTNTILRVC